MMKNNSNTTPAQSKRQAAVIRKQPYFVSVRDETDNGTMEFVVWAKDEGEACATGIQQRKEDHSQGEADDDCGFEAVACFDRNDLVRFLEAMNLPEPEDGVERV